MTDDQTWRGKIGRLATEEMEQFLAEPHFARIACNDLNGWPYVVPVWHEWDGTKFYVVGRKKSAWARYLAADPRCAVVIDESGGQRKVAAQCTAIIEETPNVGGRWVEITKRMSTRYLGENGPSYLEPTLNRERWLIALHPVWVKTWQGNDWAGSYTS